VRNDNRFVKTLLGLDKQSKIKWSMVNGQWSMVNACTPQGEPILGTGGEKKRKTGLCTLVLHAMYLTSGKRRKNLQKVQSNDGGILLRPAMVPNPCIDRKLGFDSPRCAVSCPRIGIGQMDSKRC